MIYLLVFLGLGLAVVCIAQLQKLREKIDALAARLAALEQRDLEKTPASPPAASQPQLQDERKLVPATSVTEREAGIPPPLPVTLREIPSIGSPPPLPVPPGSAALPTTTPFNWEAFMGVKLFAWLGGLALFLGILFLVKYSFENNLITPLGRVGLGGAIGGLLVAVGWWLARGRYRVTAQSLCATGIVILYADLFAAHSFYHLISLTSAFLVMSAVTLVSFILAVNLGAQVIIILGSLGGFLTPALLPSGLDNAPVLFLYIALLDLGIVAVALRKQWLYLVLFAAVGTVLTQLGWAQQFFNGTKGARAFWIFLGFEALFLGAFFVQRRRCGRFALPNPGIDFLFGNTSTERYHPRASRVTGEEWVSAAAACSGFTTLGFGFWMCAFPLLARQPLFFFAFIFLADAGLLALPVLGRAHRLIAVGAGAVTFALVATWIGLFAPKASLTASLAAIVIFAILHAATTPASAWRGSFLPFTAVGTVTPYVLLIILFERLELSDPTPTFIVAFILSAILLAAAIVRQADRLASVALFGVALLELVWQGGRFRAEDGMATLIWYGLFLALFVLYPFCSAQKDKVWPWAISALAQALQFWLCYRAITLAYPNDRMGLLPAAFIAPAAIGVGALLWLYRAIPASGDVRLAWQGGALLLFVTLIFPLQFDREWITLGWALEGIALLWLFHRVPHRGLRFVAMILLCGAFVRLALNPAVLEYHKRTGVRIWNWYLYAYGIATACLLGGAKIFGRVKEKSIDRLGRPVLGSLGVILAFLLLNLEIADYFSIGPTLTFSFSGNFARDMTYSIAWALFALGLILAGMRLNQRTTRYAGVALLGVTLIKLFLHDLSDLNELYRIGAFVGVAIILIAASFIYQRFLAPGSARE